MFVVERGPANQPRWERSPRHTSLVQPGAPKASNKFGEELSLVASAEEVSGAMSGESSETSGSMPSLLAYLVPSFDPSKDEVQIYAQKVKLVTTVWPAHKISELITRLILNTSGSAFSKLQLHQSELCVGEQKGVERLIEILGGHWGQTGLEKRSTDAERAMYQCVQQSDESVMTHI